MRGGFRGKTEEEMGACLTAAVTLFRFLQNKDEFEEWYKMHLQKRLLGNKTASDDAEKLMIVKLKSECGFQFTSKLEGMFNDLRLSRDLMERFRKERKAVATMAGASAAGAPAAEAAPPVELDVTVLTKVNWPASKFDACPLPAPVQAAAEDFRSFYLKAHSGRKLVWHTEKGTADVLFHADAGRYELTVSSWQMCVLSLLNGAGAGAAAAMAVEGGAAPAGAGGVAFGAICAALPGVPREELQRHVLSLMTPRLRILLKSSKSKEIEDGDLFSANGAFESRFLKIKVPLVSMRSAVSSGATGGGAGGAGRAGGAGADAADEEGGDIMTQVENQRKNMIEAAIVRIMKSRKTLDHPNLVAEVTRQLISRFAPNPQDVKKRIESLIEREYLERDKDDKRIYLYVA